MSDEELSTPAKVELVAWSGDVAQLAARLNMPEMELLTRLRRLSPAPEPPDDLAEQIRVRLAENPAMRWDAALLEDRP